MADGRLGNQIFQYAFLKTIAKKNETILCFNMKMFYETFDFDDRGMWHHSNYYFRLIFIGVLVPLILRSLSKARIINYVEQKKQINLIPLPYWSETRGLFPFIRYVNSDFFQSETFFNREATSNLKIKEKFLDESRQFISKIPENYNLVFVHIRRGDIVHEIFNGVRGKDLPKSYFEKAINIIKENVENPFFIFLSDDPSFVKCCFKDFEPKIISNNSMEVDLAIMTQCEAGIISNSSFSWWGAYLMTTKKKVIAPKYWVGWKTKVESHVGIQPTFSEVIDFTD
ncbi:MAG: alpha-1,2-fucosyltransferase [Methanoregula sp.]